VKVPGIIETAQDLLHLPIEVNGDQVVMFRDIATVQRTFKDPTGFARVNGKPAIALEVSKRIGAGVIETLAEVRRVVAQEREGWPAGVRVDYTQDKSDDIRTMLHDQNPARSSRSCAGARRTSPGS
jgi:multidrug efflux pump